MIDKKELKLGSVQPETKVVTSTIVIKNYKGERVVVPIRREIEVTPDVQKLGSLIRQNPAEANRTHQRPVNSRLSQN